MAAARAIHPHRGELDASGAWLLDIVAGLARTVPAGGVPGGELFLWTERYEVWRVVWAPGAGSSWHGHGRELTAFSVAEGELEERRRGGPPRRLGPGDSGLHAGALPHRLRCVGPEPVTVLQAVSPPPLGPREAQAESLACRPAAWGLKLEP